MTLTVVIIQQFVSEGQLLTEQLLPESTITHSIREKIMIRQKRQGTFVVMVQPCKPMQGK